MYKFIFSCFFLVFVFSIDGNAQAKTDISFGLRIGKSELLLDYEPITINDENGDHWRTLTLDDALNRLSRYEVGFFLFFRKKNWSLQSDFQFSGQRLAYKNSTLPGSERLFYIDAAFLMGYNFRWFRVQSGPVFHFLIDKISSFDPSFYTPEFPSFNAGWIVGLAVPIGIFEVEMRYEYNFHKLGNHLGFFGEAYQFDAPIMRLGFSAGVKF